MPHRQYWRSLGQGEILRARSQENGELAHRANDAFNRHDFDALLALIDPNIEFTSRIVELEGGEERQHSQGMEKDLPADQTQWHLAECREGKIIRWQVFVNQDEALEDAGLTPLG